MGELHERRAGCRDNWPVRFGEGALRSDVQASPEIGEANDDPVLGYPTPHNAGDELMNTATLLTVAPDPSTYCAAGITAGV